MAKNKEVNNTDLDVVPEKGADFPKTQIAEREEKILNFWAENYIFEKTLEKKAKGEYIFYDGPPFATGTPHYGHLLAGSIKDVIPRYQTMRGKKVPRRWGWDCHGLPVENLIEKELGLKTKKDIETLGIEKFNEAARASVLRYDKEWKKIVPRSGRFVDMENEYKTMDPSYTESVWWSFKTLFSKGLIFEGFKSMHLCPRCGTTLSNFEVNQGYKDITDLSVTVKFELADQPKTYLLAWTTTPWTLPGNVAAAINPEMEYVRIRIKNADSEVKSEDTYIIAKPRLMMVKDGYEIVEEFLGEKLIGKSYKPVFDYYKEARIKHIENAWKIYPAEFVTSEDGTGVVHIAPAFGEDDLNLAKKFDLPFIQHVSQDGKFKKEVLDFAGQDVKPKDDESEKDKHQKADIEIIKNLAHRGLLFSKEKIIHSYPHCWRCSTPLLNYASHSWFVDVPKIKTKIVAANKKVSWIPEDIRDGRFGKWLEGAREWAISRSRYWGAPIPVWKCSHCEENAVLGSVADIRSKTRGTNVYSLMRHGQAENNIKHVISSQFDNPHHLTEKGKSDVLKAVKGLKKRKIDLIICSDFVRTKETAEILRSALGLPEESVVFDERLREFNFGEFNLKPEEKYFASLPKFDGGFGKKIAGGESLEECKRRVGEALYDIDKRYSNKRILIVSHETPLWLMVAAASGLDSSGTAAMRADRRKDFISNAEVRDLDFAPLPHNKDYELDFHRPYIDEIVFNCVSCGKQMKRITDVFDCWYESGSVSFAQFHYPFGDLKKFNPVKNIGFPADFIAEGLDQTRGWFYSSLVLGVALFGKSPYKNVVVNGIILAEDGQKMSKSLKNYPDPWKVLSNYGADALRYYMFSSPVVRAEDLNLSEKGIDEVVKKVLMRLGNIYSFYEMYAPLKNLKLHRPASINVLDKWILARLDELNILITRGMDNYELDKASRPIADFLDDMSTWYIRRSRDRFKSDDGLDRRNSITTTSFVLFELSKLMAPFMPFVAEDLYQKFIPAVGKKGVKSVHLESWPHHKTPSIGLLNEMELVRKIVSLGLEARAKAGIKVRQPLASVTIKNTLLKGKNKLVALILDELNVKELRYDPKGDAEVLLDTVVTPKLKEEGDLRELIRGIQEMRKKNGFKPSDKVSATIKTNNDGEQFVKKFEMELVKATGLKNVKFAPTEGDKVEMGGIEFEVSLKE